MPARVPATDALTPKFMTAVIAAVVVCGHLFRPPGADAPGAGGADVLRPGAAGGAAAPSAAGPCPVGAAQPGAGAGDPVAGLGTFVGSQFAGLAADLPRYQTNIAPQDPVSMRGTTDQRHHQPAQPDHRGPGRQITGGREPARHRRGRRRRPRKSRCRWRSSATAVAPWEVAQTILGPLLEPLGTGGAGAGVCRLHPAAEGRSARPLRAAGGIARHAAHHRGAGRSGHRGCRAICSCRPSSMPVSACTIGVGPVADRHSQCRPVGR